MFEIDVELQLVLENVAARGADCEMDVAIGGAKYFQQTNSINGAASACDADNDRMGHADNYGVASFILADDAGLH
jgi:hypothetical protein